jgi:16S rRNA (uracil1498-N3)-methyltransferase
MRAKYLPDISVQETYLISGDDLHHLVHVVRMQVGDELLLLNGKGLQIKTKVIHLTKKEMALSYLSHKQAPRVYRISLSLGMPKKDALDLALKEATELGLENIYLVKSEYSQMRPLEKERLNNLLVSALEQSNAAYLPNVEYAQWETIPWINYSAVYLMDSQRSREEAVWRDTDEKNSMLIVGPEGGFSPIELDYLHGLKGITILSLPTPILRTPTALAVGAGMILRHCWIE